MIETLSIPAIAAHNTIKSPSNIANTTSGKTGLKEPDKLTIGSDQSTLSALSRQLSESAVRAQSRDQTLSFKDLGTLAKNIIDKIAGSGFYANRELHDAEVPDTDDPALLERARQTTLFERGSEKIRSRACPGSTEVDHVRRKRQLHDQRKKRRVR